MNADADQDQEQRLQPVPDVDDVDGGNQRPEELEVFVPGTVLDGDVPAKDRDAGHEDIDGHEHAQEIKRRRYGIAVRVHGQTLGALWPGRILEVASELVTSPCRRLYPAWAVRFARDIVAPP